MAVGAIRFALCILVGMHYVVHKTQAAEACTLDVENILKKLLAPQDTLSLQVQALRRGLERKIVEALDREAQQEDALAADAKRTLASLTGAGNFPTEKRNLEALARAGYIRTLPLEQEDSNYKRSIAYLAKNGQLPMKSEDNKRGIEALARNGDLHPRREIQDLIDDLYGKRNIGSLARNNYWPMSGKRSISSLARSGDLSYQYKRNLPSLARDGMLNGKRDFQADYSSGADNEDKRSLQSIKAQYKPTKFKRSSDATVETRSKRQADYYYDNEEYPSPSLQNAYDYEDVMQELNEPIYAGADKRFLGSVAKSGWFRPSSSSSSSSRHSRFVSADKRHIGSLARLGWLPAFRNVRRFNRSGRSTSSECREATSDGQTQIDTNSQDPTLSVEEKRYLYRPETDNILFRHIFYHPRSH